MLGERQACSLQHPGRQKFSTKNCRLSWGETMHLPCRAALPAPVPACLTPPPRERQALDILKVVFSTMGDLIRVHGYDNHCSATWDAVLTYGRLESERGDATIV